MLKLLLRWRLIAVVALGWFGIAALATYGRGFIFGCLWAIVVGGWMLHHVADKKQWSD